MLLDFDTERMVDAKKSTVLQEIPVKWTRIDGNKYVLNERS